MKRKAFTLMLATAILTGCGSMEAPTIDDEDTSKVAESDEDVSSESSAEVSTDTMAEETPDEEIEDESQSTETSTEPDEDAKDGDDEDEYGFDYSEWSDNALVHDEGKIFSKMFYGDRILDGDYPDGIFPFQDDSVQIMWNMDDISYDGRNPYYEDIVFSNLPVEINVTSDSEYGKMTIDQFKKDCSSEFSEDELAQYYWNYQTFNKLDVANVAFAVKPESDDEVPNMSFDTISCLYKLDGNDVIFAPFECDEDTYEITLAPEKTWFKYEVEIDVNDILLTKDNVTLRYKALGDILCRNGNTENMTVRGTTAGTMYENIGTYSFITNPYKDKYESEESHLTFGRNMEDHANDIEIVTEGYNFTMKWTKVRYGGDNNAEQDDPHTVKGSFMTADPLHSVLLIDGTWYDYTSNDEFPYGILADDLTDEEKDDAIEKGAAARDEIEKALDGSDYTVDDTGVITLDSTVLFDFDSSELSDEGKAALDDFLEKYIPVIIEQIEAGNLSGLTVSGYTDSKGKVAYNQTLSEKRAESVTSYVTENYPEIADKIDSIGYGENYLIYNEDGTENDAASRRVEFSFTVAVE